MFTQITSEGGDLAMSSVSPDSVFIFLVICAVVVGGIMLASIASMAISHYHEK